MTRVRVSARGQRRWKCGHPWIYRTDVTSEPGDAAPGVVEVADRRGRFLGMALYSPRSEIRLRLLDRQPVEIDESWWAARLTQAADRRTGIDASAYRIAHGEADNLPGLIVDRYGEHLVVQILNAGLEAVRHDVLAAMTATFAPAGVLLRNDSALRRYEDLPAGVEVATGTIPERVMISEGPIRYWANLRSGQKTGAFLDQRENRVLAGTLGRGRALDVFTYHGSFALQLGRGAAQVTGIDQSSEALERAAEHAALNGLAHLAWVHGNAFDHLKTLDQEGQRFDVIVLDPPAFARTRGAIGSALRGYKELNLRAMRLLAPGGDLLTFSCSYHVGRDLFMSMLVAAAQDSGRHLAIRGFLGPADDHPSVLSIPETAYLKGLWLRAFT